MPAQSATLFLLEDLADADRTRNLTPADLTALRAVAGWIESYVIRPNGELGRSGPVCPFVPLALNRKTLWLVAERSEGRTAADVMHLIDGYRQRLLAAAPAGGDDAQYKSILVAFTDLAPDRAKDFIGGPLQEIAVPFYTDDGLVMGPFYQGNAGTAIYNPNFRPFTSPVPFLLMRRAVVSDWKFFLNDRTWLALWGRRYGEAAVEALAEELRSQPWRERRDAPVLEDVT